MPISKANLTIKVIEYLNKKGYTKTEATLRAESANHDAEGRPVLPKSEDIGGPKHKQGFGNVNQLTLDTITEGDCIELLQLWIEDRALDTYKASNQQGS